MFNLKLSLDSSNAVFRRASVLAGQPFRVLGLQLAALEALQQVAVGKALQFDLRLRVSGGLAVDVQLGVQSN